MAASKRTFPGGWQACAERLARAMPVSVLDRSAVDAALQRRRSRWCVAFSGGADSLALVLLAWANWPDRRQDLVALHFNHGLRGRAADGDAAFCEKVCRDLGIAVRIGRWRHQQRTGRRNPAPVPESEARTARHSFFAAEMRRVKAKVLWLGHHLDDVAETMLMRLARGSGTGGLAAPRPVQDLADGRTHVRPLLRVRKAELVDALRGAGATWREDATNAEVDYFRNRVRLRVLPALVDAAKRDVLAGIGLSRERLEEDDQALERWVDAVRPITGRVLDAGIVNALPRAVRRRALHRWLLRVKPATDLSRQGFEQLLSALERGKDTRFSLGASSFAVIRRGKVRLVGA